MLPPNATHLLLDQEIDVVNAQRRELFIWSLDVKQQSTKGDVDLATQIISTNIQHPPHLATNSHILPLTLLKPIHLSITNVIEQITQITTLFPLAPAFARFVFRAVEVER